MTAGEQYKAQRAALSPARQDPESLPIGGPGSSGEPSRQRANTYLNNERLILSTLRSAIRRMRSTGRIDPDVLNAYARIKTERSERENSYGVGMDGPTQRAERWLAGMEAAGKIPAIYSAEWSNMNKARNAALEDENGTMFLEDDIRGRNAFNAQPFSITPPPNSPAADPNGYAGTESTPAQFPAEQPFKPALPDDEENPKQTSSLRNPFNSLFVV